MKLLHVCILSALPFLASFGSSKNIEQNSAAAMKEYNAGVTAQKRKSYDIAVHHYQQAIVLKPDFADAFNNLGFCYRMIAKSYLDRAGDSYQRALKIQPDHPQALEYQGEYWIMSGDLMKAYKNYLALKEISWKEAEELQEKLDEILDEAKKVLKSYKE